MNCVVREALQSETGSVWNTLPTFLRQACEPIRRWLEDPDVIEIMCNRPGEVWIESTRHADMQRFEVSALTSVQIERIAQQVASYTKQSVNEVTPLLSAAMPLGERFQGVLSPAAPHGGMFSIRKQVIRDLSLENYLDRGAFNHVKISGPREVDPDDIDETDEAFLELLGDPTPEGRMKALRFAVENKYTVLVAGGTSSGKTTFLNALLKEIPVSERILSLEDTLELKPPQPNWCALLASKGDQGLAKVTVQDLLEAAMRVRPDRLLLGEIRGADAFTFLQAVNTGHPGSLSTVHANSPQDAITRVALATMQAGLGLTKAELSEIIRATVPVFVQLQRKPTRSVSQIYFNKFQRAGR
ncbi:P-type DNA transfer ATPase VirB11 [Microvirga tunisiensis]|uniref:Type IV secretion system protein n=1 Tax=Microvirga tunisiensis TaxID=2108360 RepID=A0A5N7MJ25_9HYPH|nr:P-type DNA transfer ATPase VirB11 [Microvirga tunisiensis]MPR08862.1 P-type DNA transfer ATPase VirB11 [Microvirga tunisiensis]MPR27045.1 P-type DNA transfer ATPase VirB11 [Microvirga tunisiensis]